MKCTIQRISSTKKWILKKSYSIVAPMPSNVAPTYIPKNLGQDFNPFPITDVSWQYYKILCQLGHSKWKWYVSWLIWYFAYKLFEFLHTILLNIIIVSFLASLLYSFKRLLCALNPLDSQLNLMGIVTISLLLVSAVNFLRTVIQEFLRTISFIQKLG